MGILLCEQNFWDVWSRNERVRAEIGQILHTDTYTHTTAAKLVVRIRVLGKKSFGVHQAHCLHTSAMYCSTSIL